MIKPVEFKNFFDKKTNIKKQNDSIKTFSNQSFYTKEINKDTFEAKRQKNYKKLLLPLAGCIVLISSIFTIAKLSQISKIKKDISKCYDEIFDFIKSDCKDLNFIKPKLKFIKSKDLKTTSAFYNIAQNEICVNQKMLNPKKIFKNIDPEILICTDEIGEDSLLSYLYMTSKKSSEDIRATYDEFLFDISSHLSYELTHAKQFQEMLSAEGILRLFTKGICKSQNLTSDENQIEMIKNAFPFVFNYKPKKMTKINTAHKIKSPTITVEYTNLSTLNHYINYTDSEKNKTDYLLNPIEIIAEIGRENFIQAVFEGKLLKDLNLSQKTLQNSKLAAMNNTSVLIWNRKKSK